MTETGTFWFGLVWTGDRSNNAKNCSDWTSSSKNQYADVGEPHNPDRWRSGFGMGCDEPLPFLCFQE